VIILLAFLALAVVGAVAVAVAGRIGPGRWRRTAPGASDPDFLYGPGDTAALGEPDPRLPPVLLPDHPDAADIGKLRFSVALRGYRMDQVDEVLERLGAALQDRDEELARLRRTDTADTPVQDRPEGPPASSGGPASEQLW